MAPQLSRMSRKINGICFIIIYLPNRSERRMSKDKNKGELPWNWWKGMSFNEETLSRSRDWAESVWQPWGRLAFTNVHFLIIHVPGQETKAVWLDGSRQKFSIVCFGNSWVNARWKWRRTTFWAHFLPWETPGEIGGGPGLYSNYLMLILI